MNAKENALGIIRFDRPFRVVTGPPVHLIHYHGCHHRGFDGGGDSSPVGSRWVDIWGTEWHKVHEGVMGLPKGHPLARPEALREYTWPDGDDVRISGQISEMARDKPDSDLFLVGNHRDTLWEKAYMLVGMEALMMRFFENPGFVHETLRHIMDFQLAIARHYAQVGIEIAYLSDDLGTQRGPLLGPGLVDEFLVPEYKRLIQFYKDRGVLIWFHSCGNVETVVETFLRLGVDILDPIQVTANDLDKIRSVTQGRIALKGGVSTATIMEGPVDRITSEVRERIWQLGQDGGYFCAPDQSLPFPEAHLEAFRVAVDRFGRYPLTSP